MSGNGKLPHDQNKPPMEPLPQTGSFPLEKLCYWFGKDREQMLEALKLINVYVDEQGLVDMEKVIEGIERRRRERNGEES